MTAVEGRLRAVARALAESVPDTSIPPLRLPAARRHAHPPVWFAPLAAAAAMALIAGLVWTATIARARITPPSGSAVAVSTSVYSQASRHSAAPAGRLARQLPASVQPALAASRYSPLSLAGIKGPGQRNLLGIVFGALARDSAAYSSSCAHIRADRQDVCTVGA